jgi:hypothetical protein
MPVDLELWNKLNDFQLDDPRAHVRFTDRLAHENGWPKAFARRAVDEYKKFVYLAATSATPVTPSDVVDQVWHLHLTFTRSYWDDMCAGLLGHALHHGPTKGGSREDAKYRRQYAETLALYRCEFGTEPPADFWPPEAERFAGAPHQRWVDVRTHLVIRKPTLSPAWTTGAIAATAAVAATGTAAAAAGSDSGDTTAALMLGGVAAASLLLFAMLGSRGNGRRRRARDDGSSGAFIGSTSSGGKDKIDGGEGGESGGEGGGGEGGGGDGGGSGCGGGGCGSS